MNRLGYDRDFAEVLPGVDGDLPPVRAVPGWRSVSIDRGRRRRPAAGAHRPRPRGDSQGPGGRPGRGDHPRPARVRRARLARRRCVGGGPGARRRVRHRHRRHLHLRRPAETVAISSGGLASSGIGVRQWRLGAHRVHHIVDPATGLSAAPCWRTVSTTAATCVQANAASTAAIVLGERAVDWLEGHRLPARLVRLDGTVVYTTGLADPRSSACPWPELSTR